MRLSRRRGDLEGGSVLILVPVGILVLLALATMAVDGANAVLGQRQLANALAAAASDAATAGLDNRAFYGSGVVALDPVATESAVCEAVAAQGNLHLRDVRLAVGVAGPVVTVRGTGEVAGVFGGAFPGLRFWKVAAVAIADAETAPRAPPAPAPTTPVPC